MKPPYGCIALCLFLILPGRTIGQETTGKLQVSGYASAMQSAMVINKAADSWVIDNLLHNRVNFRWDPSSRLTVAVEIRNRLIYGDRFRISTQGAYMQALTADRGIVDLSANLAKGNSFVLNSMIDRAYVHYRKNRFEATLGRQRINWGQAFVWNPNDLFNNFSYFDFDYIEKPGGDALRLEYYTGNTSAAEFAIKADSGRAITAAALYRFNQHGYDLQLLAGVVDSDDMSIGAGWSGNLGRIAFRGEATYLHPLGKLGDSTGLVLISTGFDHTFSNSLFVQTEALYSNKISGSLNQSVMGNLGGLAGIKSLAFTEWSIFCNVAYPLTPLVQSSIGVMFFPKLRGFFTGPSLVFSASENLELAFYYQLFSIEIEHNRQNIHLGFLRFKYSF